MRRTVIFLGIVILTVLAGWLFWREWQQRLNLKPLPVARNKLVNRIPTPPPSADKDSGYKRSSPEVESPEIPQPHRMGEPAATDRIGDPMAKVPQGAGSDSRQEAPLLAARQKNDSGAKASALQQKEETEGKPAAEQTSEKPPQGGFVIQVGAFRSLSAAKNLQKGLKEKGYNAYLDGAVLPDLGLMHRVRIRGYASAVAAKADAERLKREEGLDSIVLSSE